MLHVQVVDDMRREVNTAITFSELRVLNASLEEDTGVYSCRAENYAGTAEYAVTVTIIEFFSEPLHTYHHS